LTTLVYCALTLSAVAADNDERQPSMFKVGEEWLALPEVFSNLDFTADSTPANEADIAGQIQLRSTRFWGRLYIDGWPQTIQFFRAHFGIEPPLGKKTFVFAEPRDACSDLTNANILTSDHVLLVNRGTCTFGTKAKFASKTNATAVIVINNEPGIDHLPGPDAHDIQFSITSIAQQEGQLLEAVYDEGPMENGFGRKLEGYIVPINCENSGAKCVPATYEERRGVANLAEGGTLEVVDSAGVSVLKDGDAPIEYLLAHFGTMVTADSVSTGLVVAKPAEACGPLENDVRGKVVLVRRGSCAFVKKAEEVQAAGGRTMIVGSVHPYIVRMGVEPRWKGLNSAIPVVMVSKRAYSILVAESYSGGSRVAFRADRGVAAASSDSSTAPPTMTINGATWEPLEKLSKGEGWPRSEAYTKKRYEELLEQHSAWPDRVETLKDAYARKLKEDEEKLTGQAGAKSEL